MPIILKRTLEFRWEVRPRGLTIAEAFSGVKATENVLQQKYVGVNTDDVNWIDVPFVIKEAPKTEEV